MGALFAMNKAARSRGWCLANALPIVVLGCSSRDLPSEREWTSAHFRYHTRSRDKDACADLLDPLEQHFTTLTSYLGVAWPAGRAIDYYKFADSSDLHAHGDCGE